MHSFESRIPSGDDLARSIGEYDWFIAGMIMRRVELCAIRKPPGVMNGVVLLRLRHLSRADLSIDITQGVKIFGSALDLWNRRRIVRSCSGESRRRLGSGGCRYKGCEDEGRSKNHRLSSVGQSWRKFDLTVTSESEAEDSFRQSRREDLDSKPPASPAMY